MFCTVQLDVLLISKSYFQGMLILQGNVCMGPERWPVCRNEKVCQLTHLNEGQSKEVMLVLLVLLGIIFEKYKVASI